MKLSDKNIPSFHEISSDGNGTITKRISLNINFIVTVRMTDNQPLIKTTGKWWHFEVQFTRMSSYRFKVSYAWRACGAQYIGYLVTTNRIYVFCGFIGFCARSSMFRVKYLWRVHANSLWNTRIVYNAIIIRVLLNCSIYVLRTSYANHECVHIQAGRHPYRVTIPFSNAATARIIHRTNQHIPTVRRVQ